MVIDDDTHDAQNVVNAILLRMGSVYIYIEQSSHLIYIFDLFNHFHLVDQALAASTVPFCEIFVKIICCAPIPSHPIPEQY